MLPVRVGIVGLFNVLFVDFDLLLDIFEVILPVLKIELLHIILFDQIFVLFFLSLYCCLDLLLLLPESPQSQVYLKDMLPSLSTFVLLSFRIFLSISFFFSNSFSS